MLPLSLGFCVLLNVMSARNMVCRRDDVAGSISHNTPGDILHPKSLSVNAPSVRAAHLLVSSETAPSVFGAGLSVPAL